MPVVPRPAAPTHDLGGTRFTSLATPSRGSTQTAVWQVEIDPDTPAVPHSLTAEEIFVVLEGTATVTLAGTTATAHPGDAVVVPPGVPLAIGAERTTVRMLCCMPVGGQAVTEAGPFTPAWAS